MASCDLTYLLGAFTMPRKRRFWEQGRCYHIMLRGIDGRAIFVDDRDRCRFSLFLQEASELHKFRVHAFCLMSNHIHLLLEPLQEVLSSGVHRFTMQYAQYFNRRHQKRGYVFQGRFRSILVEDGCYMRRLVRYIHLNPIEAGLSLKPDDYRWSSHNAYFGRTVFTWLETERVLSYFGETQLVALSNFADFMAAKVDATDDKKEIERASRLGVFGSQEFRRAFLVTSRSDQQPTDEICSTETLLKAICERFGITANQMSSGEKTRQVVDARATLARAAQALSGLSLGDVGSLLGKRQSNISRLAKRCTKSPKLQAIVDELVLSFSQIDQIA